MPDTGHRVWFLRYEGGGTFEGPESHDHPIDQLRVQAMTTVTATLIDLLEQIGPRHSKLSSFISVFMHTHAPNPQLCLEWGGMLLRLALFTSIP